MGSQRGHAPDACSKDDASPLWVYVAKSGVFDCFHGSGKRDLGEAVNPSHFF